MLDGVRDRKGGTVLETGPGGSPGLDGIGETSEYLDSYGKCKGWMEKKEIGNEERERLFQNK